MLKMRIKMIIMCGILTMVGMFFCGCDKKNFWSDFDDDKKEISKDEAMKLIDEYMNKGIEVKRVVLKGKLY